MGFFKRSNDKRPAPKWKKKDPTAAKKSKPDSDISSDEDEANLFNDAENAKVQEYSDEDFEDVQTAAYRQAKQLLEKVKGAEEQETDEEDNDAIAHRLIRDVQEKRGILFRRVAEKLTVDEDKPLIYRPHRFSPVAIAVSNDSKYIVSCGKDGNVVKYDLTEKKKVGTVSANSGENGHQGHIMAIAISPDSRYLVTGGVDTNIK
uniref:Uncharacterized protein n=1 Tax=Panagrolaimus sp. JU765 TaxID=591449 RepID=A0AC34RE73_9BILA